MCRAATRWTGSASSAIRTPSRASSCRNRTAPEPATDGGGSSAATRSASSSGRQTSGSQSRSPRCRVERREDLAAVAVEHRQPLAPRPRPPPIPRPSASSVQTPRAGRPGRRRARARWRSPIRRPVKEPGPSPTAIRSTRSQPPAAVGRAPRPRSSSAGRVPRPPVRGEPQLRLVQDLAVAPGAGGGVGGRGVEADDDQASLPLLALDPEDEGADFLALRRTS